MLLLYDTSAFALTDFDGPFGECWLHPVQPQWWLLPAAAICAGAGTFSIAKQKSRLLIFVLAVVMMLFADAWIYERYFEPRC
jgi:hypothetical protein